MIWNDCVMAESSADEPHGPVRRAKAGRPFVALVLGMIVIVGCSAVVIGLLVYRDRRSVISHPCQVSLQEQVAQRYSVSHVSQNEVTSQDDSTESTWCVYEVANAESVEVQVHDATTGDWVRPLKGRGNGWIEHSGPGRGAAYSTDSAKLRVNGGYRLYYRAVGTSHAVDVVVNTSSSDRDDVIIKASLVAGDALVALGG